MKFFTKALIILAVILLILALGDSIFNGLFSNDGYRPVTPANERDHDRNRLGSFFDTLSLIFTIFLQIVHIFATGCS